MNSTRARGSRSVHQIRASAEENPYLRPAFTLRDRIRRQVWNVVWLLLYVPTPVMMFGWRAMLLRIFGAKLGKNMKFYPRGRVWAPWNLECEDMCTLANGAEIYNPSSFRMGTHAIISQGGYICGATHDYEDPDFPMISYPMEMGAYSWVCARASVAPGVMLGEGAVLGLGSVATESLEPWSIYSGNPAVRRKARKLRTKMAE